MKKKKETNCKNISFMFKCSGYSSLASGPTNIFFFTSKENVFIVFFPFIFFLKVVASRKSACISKSWCVVPTVPFVFCVYMKEQFRIKRMKEQNASIWQDCLIYTICCFLCSSPTCFTRNLLIIH